MTIREFILQTKNDAELMKALDAEKPEGLEAFVEFAKRHGCDIDPKEMEDAALSDVVGGMIPIQEPNAKAGLCWHTGCGGLILNVGNLFRDCECKVCHEKHYLLWSFDYYTT